MVYNRDGRALDHEVRIFISPVSGRYYSAMVIRDGRSECFYDELSDDMCYGRYISAFMIVMVD